MTKLLAAIFAGSLLLSAAPGSAMPMHRAMMHSSMAMPKCTAADPVVGMNMMTHMYMTHSQMKTKMRGMSNAQIHSMIMRNHVRLMCKSKADATGAKMMKAPV